MNGRVPFSLLCAAALAFACGPRPRTEASAASRTSRASHSKKNVEAHLSPSLDVRVEDGVRFAFTVVNDGDRKLEVNFRDSRTHDVVVLDASGKEVWRWSAGRMFTQAMQNKVLRTDDALRYEESWDAPARGKYTAVAMLASSNYPVEQRVEFEVR